ncbi:MAG: hypothetical protein AAFX85_10415, partial [Pseudomonadota bacterium]
MGNLNTTEAAASGAFVEMDGERFYAIREVDALAPFFVSVVSNDDHWLFVSSTGGLTAGRVSPDTALFPYITVDRLHECVLHTGPKTLIRMDEAAADQRPWEPFNAEHDGRFAVTRNLYKNVLGNKLCFEEINHDLDLRFRYCWSMGGRFGLVRSCALANLRQGVPAGRMFCRPSMICPRRAPGRRVAPAPQRARPKAPPQLPQKGKPRARSGVVGTN